MNNRDYFCQENISFKSTGRISNNNTERNLTESILIFFLFHRIKTIHEYGQEADEMLSSII